MDSPNFQFETKTEYKDRDKGTGAWAIKPGPPAIPPIPFIPGEPVFTEDFEGVPWSDLFLVSVDGWSVQTIDAHSPTHSFETDHLGAYVYSFVFNDFSFSPQLSFWFKTDLVPSASDIFEVLFDGTPVFTITDPVLDWTYVALDKGFTFNIEFRFTQNFPIVTNSVFVRVDDIVVGEIDTPGVPGSPAHPYVYTPLVLCEDDRLLVSPAVETVLEVPEVIVATEDFETDPITGSGTWTLTGSSPHTGTRCLRSAVISDGQSTDYTFSVPVGADTIRVWSRVSSEAGFDWFRVYKDAVDPGNLLYEKSGTDNIWEQQTLDITESSSVIFRYIKDSSASSGDDAAFIDDIEWVTAAIPEHEECAPLRLTSDGELEIRPLDCGTDSITVCPPVSGTFDVEVVNEIVTRPLDCEIDSITVCPPVSGSFDVEIVNEVNTRLLDCLTDSITVCPPVSGSFDVEVTNEVNIRPLDCLTDSVSVCLDEPIEVTGTVSVSGTVNVTGTVIIDDVYNPVSVFYTSFGESPFTPGADSATGGRLWLVNPIGSSVLAIVREIRYTCVISNLLDLGNALPVLHMERMSFTGTPSGAQITPGKRDTTNPNNVATLRTANTGMTITTGPVVRKFAPAHLSVIGGLLSANTAATVPSEQVFEPQDRRLIVLRPGEGVVFRQGTAGNGTEGRSFMLNIMWEEA